MAVRGEEVASSIDAQVREAIEKMVAEIRSSVEDVQLAVDQQLKAALQSVQADVNAISLLPQIRKAIGELEETYSARTPAPAASGAGRVKAAVQTIERGKSQVDVLNALLEQCLSFGSRAALLILRGETFSGWKGVGFGAHGGNDESVKRFNAAPGLVPELDRVLREEQVVVWDGASLASRLGVSGGERAVLVPMVIKDKVAAAVYVDAVAEDLSKLDQHAIELLVFTTGLLVDTLAIRRKIPSPSLSGGEPAAAAVPAPQPALPSAVPSPAPASPAPAPSFQLPPRIESGMTPPTPAPSREPLAAQRPTFTAPAADTFGGISAPTPPPAPTPTPTPAPAPAARGGGSAASEDRPSTQYIPPPGLARASALGGSSDDVKKHDEARRFARLLVSEIKLYNESRVEQGRKNNDLYDRLKEDIDRSRQMYDERIGDDVRKVSNYFYDELVRILADGNSEALGL